MNSIKLVNEEYFDDKYTLLQNENFKLQEKLKKYNNIQQDLIAANYLIDKQLDTYKKLNYYIKSFIESKNIKDFKSLITQAVVDIFSSESSMVVFSNQDELSIYTEGLKKEEYSSRNIFKAIEKTTLNISEKKPFYLSEKDINDHTALEKFQRILLRKFESKEEDFQFFIIGMVSKKMEFCYDKLNFEALLMFDNFSEQLFSILNSRIYKENLISEKEKYKGIIANMHLGLLEVDDNEMIHLVNQSFCYISGYTEEELIGKRAFDILLDDKGRLAMKKIISLRNKKQSSIYETEIINKKGEKRTWLISGAPNFGIKGEPVGSIGIHLDITNQKNLEKNLIKSNNQLKKINTELDTFVYRISHDLRTPLLSMMGLIDLIQDGNDDTMSDSNKDYFNLMSESVNRLDKTIQEILYYSRNSKLDLQIESIDIQKLIYNIYDDLKYVSKKRITFETNFNEIHFINSDKVRLETVLKNIISNSVKYLKPNIDKSFVKFAIAKEKSKYIITITDNGIGIEKENLDKIFNMFYRATSNAFGTGLGLFIVKETLGKLKGKISVNSEINVGTKFIITLPIKQTITPLKNNENKIKISVD
ncbi:MAG: PAS domain-containing sensor histidine kinase [Flaviramulus sp.]|nr:PAS domain-containing sensor histidine kinase [Flaviramulus sp.]